MSGSSHRCAPVGWARAEAHVPFPPLRSLREFAYDRDLNRRVVLSMGTDS